jgi:anaerobic ribonucleoside-triphosphate reductase activating protein
MHYGELKKCDIANGTGVRVTLFVSGCTNHCEGCFQPQTWDFCYGRPFTEETEAELFAELDKGYVDGLTVLGGEPFEPKNQPTLTALLRRVKERYPNKTVWCFTGFRLHDELLCDGSYPRTELTDEMLSYIDILVDGRFMLELKDISLQFRGSRNQRIIDMNKTRQSGEIVIWEQLRR